MASQDRGAQPKLKLVVLGATGATDQLIVSHAPEQGHHVTAPARHSERVAASLSEPILDAGSLRRADLAQFTIDAVHQPETLGRLAHPASPGDDHDQVTHGTGADSHLPRS